MPEHDAFESVYRPESERRIGLTAEHENGAQEIGRRALITIVKAAIGAEVKPLDPSDRLGLKYYHDDGSYDTGLRAAANVVREA